MNEETEKDVDYGALGVILGVILVVLSVIMVAMISFSHDEDKSGDGVTWVG